MKRFLLVTFLGFYSIILFGQDVITKKDGNQIKVKVIEVTPDLIKYKDFDFQDGPLRNIKISDVFMIVYQNGKKEVFNSKETQQETQISKTDTPVEKELPASRSAYKGNYFMLGTGLGASYGCLGVKVQGRFGGKVGFGVHAGVGIFPDGMNVCGSVGFKFFPYKGLYVNWQFGVFDYQYGNLFSPYDDSSIPLYGPSILLGIDQVFGKKVGFGFNAGLGAQYVINGYEPGLTPALDLGFLIRF